LAVAGKEQEMDLMDVEFVRFQAPILNGPVLDPALGSRDSGWIVGAESDRGSAVDGDAAASPRVYNLRQMQAFTRREK
jgi:hypothetical protein